MKVVVKVGADGGGRVRAWCPALPGCITYGKTEDDALARIENLAKGYLASLDVPLPKQPVRVTQPESETAGIRIAIRHDHWRRNADVPVQSS